VKRDQLLLTVDDKNFLASLEQAIDPAANVGYAAEYLSSLYTV